MHENRACGFMQVLLQRTASERAGDMTALGKQGHRALFSRYRSGGFHEHGKDAVYGLGGQRKG